MASTNPRYLNHSPGNASTGRTDEQAESLEWIDGTGRAWRLELEDHRIALSSGTDRFEIPKDAWKRDIYVTPHDDEFIVRFETFDRGLVFSLSGPQAMPLLEHLGTLTGVRQQSSNEADEPITAKLLWPKVSPLAIWALISSGLVFLPVVGLLPAMVTTALLLLHRARVRRSRAWSHSRAACAVAVCYLMVGLVASALGTIGLMANKRASPSPSFYGDATTLPGASLHADGVAVPLNFRARVRATSTATGASENPRRSRSDRGTAVPEASIEEKQIAQSSTPLIAANPLSGRNWGLVAAGLIVILLSLTVHEAGHAISAWWLGDDLAQRMGRVTLNPLSHVDPFGTILFPLILFLAGSHIFGWARPVPVRTEVLARPRRGHILISLAGPGANLLMAAASMSLLIILGCTVSLMVPDAQVVNYARISFSESVTASGFALAPVFGAVCTILKLSLVINVFLACFNLIPVPPLDGSWVLENLFPRRLGPFYDAIRPYGLLVFLGLMYSGLLTYLLYPAYVALAPCILILEGATHFS